MSDVLGGSHRGDVPTCENRTCCCSVRRDVEASCDRPDEDRSDDAIVCDWSSRHTMRRVGEQPDGM